MDTLVSIEIVGATDEQHGTSLAEAAFCWFERVEERCSRFEPASELMSLCAQPGVPVEASPLLFQAIAFALAVARASNGAFDPTIGVDLERAGFNQNYRTGARVLTSLDQAPGTTFEDVILDSRTRTVTLLKPMVLDLGAVAKGFAMDLAAKELRILPGFAINAGGDVLVNGVNPEGVPWVIGVRHPRGPGDLIDILQPGDCAVCTSGDYERERPDGQGHHILDPRSRRGASAVASVTVVGQTALLADALSTAAFVLGPAAGIDLLEGHGVEGLIVTRDLRLYETSGFARFRP